jgi:hypothetical protein
MLWAFYLPCWQVACRSGDLLLGKKGRDRGRAWDPQLDTHRRRLRIEKVVNDLGQDTGRRRAVLAVKPGKTDPAGAGRFEKSFIVDSYAHSLSAGYALVCMIQGARPQAGAPSTVPLFLARLPAWS